MKTKFAKEKSEYAHLISQLMSNDNSLIKYFQLIKLKKLEDKVKEQGDELIFIVTTKNTNPLEEGKTCAPPMS